MCCYVQVCRCSEYLFGSQHHRDHTLRLSGLSALINEDGAKLHLGQSRVTSSNAGTADDVSILNQVKHSWVSVQVCFFSSRAEKVDLETFAN